MAPSRWGASWLDRKMADDARRKQAALGPVGELRNHRMDVLRQGKSDGVVDIGGCEDRPTQSTRQQPGAAEVAEPVVVVHAHQLAAEDH